MIRQLIMTHLTLTPILMSKFFSLLNLIARMVSFSFQSNSSKVVEQLSSSSSNVVVNRKRTRKALTQIPKDKENCISFDDKNNDEHDDDDIISSVGSHLSTAVRQTRKKKRRY